MSSEGSAIPNMRPKAGLCSRTRAASSRTTRATGMRSTSRELRSRRSMENSSEVLTQYVQRLGENTGRMNRFHDIAFYPVAEGLHHRILGAQRGKYDDLQIPLFVF